MPSNFYPEYLLGELHPETESFLSELEISTEKPLTAKSPVEARDAVFPVSWLGPVDPDVVIRNLKVPGPEGPIPIRIYSAETTPNQPLLLFFHGGGFVVGTLMEFDPLCGELAKHAACTVVSVDYRLAPEHRFPAAVNDAWAALSWVVVHAEELGCDSARIAVAGDSAGANLAANLCLQARDEGYPLILHQIVICPCIDLSDSAVNSNSFRAFGCGKWLSTANFYWYRNHYVKEPGQANHPVASPLFAKCFHGLPPALVVTAEFDVLGDQGRAFAGCLEEAGVPVTFRQFPGMIHDFVLFSGRFTEARAAVNQVVKELREAFQELPAGR